MAELAYWRVYTMNKVEARNLLIQTYQETKSISQTAQCWHTSRLVVRKWLKRYEWAGLEGLHDLSRRPALSPHKTPPETERRVLEAWKRTGYGRKRLALYLKTKGLDLSPHTLRHILRRVRPPQPRKRRKVLYPAHWAWEQEVPFRLLQTDTKDIHDKASLGTALTTHLVRHHLPRYQWTACDGRTRVRFLAYSYHLNRTNGLAFLLLVLMWLRTFGVEGEVEFQVDWGQEFGGDNPERIAQLSQRFLRPRGGELRCYPPGRKGYNGRVERSHRTDDEEFYRVYLAKAKNCPSFLELAQRWVYFYNVLRPHTGEGMDSRPPLAALKACGYTGDERIALLPPVLLDEISTDILLNCNLRGGNDLLAHYSRSWRREDSGVQGTIFSSAPTTAASVVSTMPAQLAAFRRARRTALAESIIPFSSILPYSPAQASKPMFSLSSSPCRRRTLASTTAPSSPALAAIWRSGSSRARRRILRPAASSPSASVRSSAAAALSRATPPPGTRPSNMALFMLATASSSRKRLSFLSLSVAPPYQIIATPPVS